MAQDWEFAGVNLTTPAYTVQYLGASPNTPARRGEDLVIPGKTGRYLTTGKKLDSRTVALAMWVKDVDPSTGAIAGTPEAQLQRNLDTLRAMIATDGTALLKYTMGGTTRQAPAEIISSTEFEPFGTAPYYRFVIEWSLADPLWRAENTRTGTASIATNPQNVTLVNNGTYRNEHATLAIVTPASGTVVDPRFTIGADYVQYTGTVAESGTLTIDCSAWTATNGTVDVSGDITHDGDLVWLPIPVGTAVTMAFSAGTVVGTPTVTVSYLERFI